MVALWVITFARTTAKRSRVFRRRQSRESKRRTKILADIVTADLSQFGHRELRLASELLSALVSQGTPDELGDGITLNFNTHSGYVFISDEDYNTAMMNGDKLETWFSCPECGHEGFKEDMAHDGSAECRRYLKDIGVDEDDASEEYETDA
jgi:hypothetical protein